MNRITKFNMPIIRLVIPVLPIVTQAPASAVWWWLRSPNYSNYNNFLIVSADGSCNTGNANLSGGVRPGFAV